MQRVLDRLPALSTGYEPGLRAELLLALACFAGLAPDVRRQVPGWLAGIGWVAADTDEGRAGA